MIGRIAGVLLEKRPPALLVDAGGVGYEIDVPMSTFYGLPAIGERITLLTHLAIREDAHQLFGFASAKERDAFRLLIRISGIGARTALAVLSGMSVDELATAVASQDTARITHVPGIGKKTAERLLLELKGKLGDALPMSSSASLEQGDRGDILKALLALGYSEREANQAARQVPPDTSVSEGIRLALKSLAKVS